MCSPEGRGAALVIRDLRTGTRAQGVWQGWEGSGAAGEAGPWGAECCLAGSQHLKVAERLHARAPLACLGSFELISSILVSTSSSLGRLVGGTGVCGSPGTSMAGGAA